MTNLPNVPWRTGRKVGRTIYAQVGPDPSDVDPLIGVMDTKELAQEAVVCHNEHRVRIRCSCYEAGRNPSCPIHSGFAGSGSWA